MKTLYTSAEAAKQGDIEYFVDLERRFGPGPAHLDADGRSHLHLAAANGRLELMDWLLERGAQVDIRDRDGTALHKAAHGSEPNALALLLAHGADARAAAQFGRDALMVAARSGSIACVYVLLDHLADVDLDRGDEDGMTAALHAAQGRYTEIYACLDARRRDPDRADSQGRTALFWACRNRDAVLRDYLVDVAGASFEYAALLHRDVDPDWVAQAQGPRPPRERTGVLRA